MTAKVGEFYRLARLAAGDSNAAFETNEFDACDFEEGGDGIVYASSIEEAARARQQEAPKDAREPDHTKKGMFVLHRCWKCNDGARPCPQGNPRQCEFPHARDD